MSNSQTLSAPMSRRFSPFGTTIFAEMSALARASGAINLSQGYPDFEGPSFLIERVNEAMRAGNNQYARSMGHPKLTEAISKKIKRFYGLDWNSTTEVLVTCGATEGIAAALLGIVNPGDEVVLFEPYFDVYEAAVAMAGGVCKYVTLKAPNFGFSSEDLRNAFSEKTRLVLLNTPHNPTGKVFSHGELAEIGALCIEHGAYILSDEVYEHITFDGAQHIGPASLPELTDRTLTVTSTGKTFSMTGWKIGYASGPAPLIQAMQAAHQYLTFSVAAPLQLAMAEALALEQTFFDTLKRDYQARRDVLIQALNYAGLTTYKPAGTYFVLVDVRSAGFDDDRTFATYMAQEIGVACIPTSAFYTQGIEEGKRLARFAFCKELKTLEAAGERLKKCRHRTGRSTR